MKKKTKQAGPAAWLRENKWTCAVLAAAVSLWCMGDNLWPVVKENGAAWVLNKMMEGAL